MIVAWMVFTLVTGCALTVAALAADRIALLGQRPQRFVWLAAMLATVCWPAFTLLPNVLSAAQRPAISLPIPDVHRLTAFVVSAPAWEVSSQSSALIILAWVLVSTGLLVRLLLAVSHIRRHRVMWREIEIDGQAVHLAGNAGPAVIGLHPMQVVLPEWVLGLDQQQRELILRHECEHQQARDPYLLLCAALLTALFPWNLPLWYQVRRLRLAIEIDCDLRVLRAHSGWHEYALLLLTIAQRQSAMARALMPALAEPTSNLERRITAMRTFPPLSPLRAILLGTSAIAAFALACAVDKPEGPERSNPSLTVNAPTSRGTRSPELVDATRTAFFEFQVEKPVVERETSRVQYPPAMKRSGIEGDVLAQFVVDQNGRVDMQSFKALKTAGPDFTAAVREALPKWRFDPAEVGGRKVSQLVQQVFEFRIPPPSP